MLFVNFDLHIFFFFVYDFIRDNLANIDVSLSVVILCISINSTYTRLNTGLARVKKKIRDSFFNINLLYILCFFFFENKSNLIAFDRGIKFRSIQFPPFPRDERSFYDTKSEAVCARTTSTCQAHNFPVK